MASKVYTGVMLVRDVMAKKVITVSPSESFSRMVRILIEEKISGFVVVNRFGKVLGVISEKDLLYKLFPEETIFYKDIKHYMNFENICKEATKVSKLKARSFMSKEVISVGPDDHILKACSIFVRRRIRRLPVIDNGKLVGIVTTNDIYKNFLKTLADCN